MTQSPYFSTSPAKKPDSDAAVPMLLPSAAFTVICTVPRGSSGLCSSSQRFTVPLPLLSSSTRAHKSRRSPSDSV